MKIVDISLPIKNNMIIYPNNPEVLIEKFSDLPNNSSRVSKITLGSHTGTHIDAPSHTLLSGKNIEIYNLENFIGPCKVFDFSYLASGETIKIPDFENALRLQKIKIEKGDKILMRTSNSVRGFDHFYDDFVALDGECAKWLADKNISLIGIDYLSIKKRGSNDNRAHNVFLEKNIPILEGINLKDVSAGKYEIICFPLKIEEIDGSLCRAVLKY
jgi:arylformamidase